MRRGCSPLGETEKAQIASLMRLHLETHPGRVARLYGVTGQYVRLLWREHLMGELLSAEHALEVLRERLVQATVPKHGSFATIKTGAGTGPG